MKSNMSRCRLSGTSSRDLSTDRSRVGIPGSPVPRAISDLRTKTASATTKVFVRSHGLAKGCRALAQLFICTSCGAAVRQQRSGPMGEPGDLNLEATERLPGRD